MGDPRANMPNIDFRYGLALDAARDLYRLCNVIIDKNEAWKREANKALWEGEVAWEGGHSDTFQANLGTSDADSSTISLSMADLVYQFRTQWAKAWGEQDRINHARWAQAERDDDGWFENNVVELVYDEETGPPPEDPDAPSGPDFSPTRAPIHPEHETDNGQPSYRRTTANV